MHAGSSPERVGPAHVPYQLTYFRSDAWSSGPTPSALPSPISSEPRPVQKHKRTQDWRAGPFRSSSTRGEPQIRGVSEAMSAIRVLRTRRENTVQQRDATLPGRRPGSRSWAKMDIKEARATPGPERASWLRRGSPGLDSGPLRWPLFGRRTARSAARSPLWRKRGTRKSRLETKTENEVPSAVLARLW